MEYTWEKPVIIFYRERLDEPERKAFLVVKAKKLIVTRSEEKTMFIGTIKDFFPLMGDIGYISSERGISDQYVLCWFEDEENDFSKAWRRVIGVKFPDGTSFVTDKDEKRTYNAKFEAEKGKLK